MSFLESLENDLLEKEANEKKFLFDAGENVNESCCPKEKSSPAKDLEPLAEPHQLADDNFANDTAQIIEIWDTEVKRVNPATSIVLAPYPCFAGANFCARICQHSEAARVPYIGIIEDGYSLLQFFCMPKQKNSEYTIVQTKKLKFPFRNWTADKPMSWDSKCFIAMESCFKKKKYNKSKIAIIVNAIKSKAEEFLRVWYEEAPSPIPPLGNAIETSEKIEEEEIIVHKTDWSKIGITPNSKKMHEVLQVGDKVLRMTKMFTVVTEEEFEVVAIAHSKDSFPFKIQLSDGSVLRKDDEIRKLYVISASSNHDNSSSSSTTNDNRSEVEWGKQEGCPFRPVSEFEVVGLEPVKKELTSPSRDSGVVIRSPTAAYTGNSSNSASRRMVPDSSPANATPTAARRKGSPSVAPQTAPPEVLSSTSSPTTKATPTAARGKGSPSVAPQTAPPEVLSSTSSPTTKVTPTAALEEGSPPVESIASPLLALPFSNSSTAAATPSARGVVSVQKPSTRKRRRSLSDTANPAVAVAVDHTMESSTPVPQPVEGEEEITATEAVNEAHEVEPSRTKAAAAEDTNETESASQSLFREEGWPDFQSPLPTKNSTSIGRRSSPRLAHSASKT